MCTHARARSPLFPLGRRARRFARRATSQSTSPPLRRPCWPRWRPRWQLPRGRSWVEAGGQLGRSRWALAPMTAGRARPLRLRALLTESWALRRQVRYRGAQLPWACNSWARQPQLKPLVGTLQALPRCASRLILLPAAICPSQAEGCGAASGSAAPWPPTPPPRARCATAWYCPPVNGPPPPRSMGNGQRRSTPAAGCCGASTWRRSLGCTATAACAWHEAWPWVLAGALRLLLAWITNVVLCFLEH
jgi:hypothetical protein